MTSLRCAIILPLIVVGLCLPILPRANASGNHVLDGVGTNTTCGVNCRAESLTTERGHDVVILIAECGFTSCSSTISTISDSSGLNFTQRISYAPSDKLWEFYARAMSPLKSDNISAVSTGTPIWDMQVFAIHSANTAAVFDQSPRFPETLSCLGPGGTSVTTCSASIGAVDDDFIIASTAINDAPACSPSSGFATLGGGGGVLAIDYRIVSTPQNSLAFTCSATDPVAMVVDAIQIS
jgi:hypothetical protein